MNLKLIDRSITSDKQIAFFKAKTKHVGFGGARGGGKSWAVQTKAILLCLKYEKIKVLIVRKTYPELINNHINPMMDRLHGVAKYNKSEKVFKFGNGSTIKFGYCACDSDLEQYQGAEYDVIFLDEATQLQVEWIQKITACVRGVNNFPKRIYYTCNPGGASHGYFKRIFVDQKYNEGEDPSEYTFIQSLVTDNLALMRDNPDYLKQLEALPPKLQKAWRYGDWNIYEGQFFEDFIDNPKGYEDRTYTHVIPAFDIPRTWNVYRSYDFGYNKPFSCAWWAVDPEGVVYRILELYGCTKNPNEGVKWTPEKQFSEIAKTEREHPWLKGRNIQGVADPSIWDASRGESVADVAMKHGIYFVPGDNKRIAGWMQMHYRFAFDENGYPMMYIFDNCKAFIRTIPLLIYSETKPEDLDTSLEDHVADEARYFCMTRPIAPRIKAEAPEIGDDPLNMNIKTNKLSIRRYN